MGQYTWLARPAFTISMKYTNVYGSLELLIGLCCVLQVLQQALQHAQTNCFPVAVQMGAQIGFRGGLAVSKRSVRTPGFES